MIDEKKVREKLQSELDQVAARIAAIQAAERRETSEGQTDGAHLWEDADIRDADLVEATDERNRLTEALQRVDLGSYGVCSICGGPIPDGRLEVMPSATTCVDCAE